MNNDAAEYIRTQIFTKKLRPGDRISQDELAEELGISKLPVREALLAMSAEGLIELKARRGAFVASMEPQDIADQFEAYGLVHGLAAAHAAPRMPKDELNRLRELNEAFGSAISLEEKREIDWTFHRTINTAGASHRLTTYLKAMSRFARSLPYSVWSGDAEVAELGKRQHARIIDALSKGDSKLVEQLCREHLVMEGQALISVMKKERFWS
jgi:DNA-binding GntR family transcriptional regulator